MKGFLFDENLPSKLTVQPFLPVVSSSSLGASPTDTQIWQHAKREELVVVTKDFDFSDRIILQNPPHWVVHIRFGNLRRREFHALLSRASPQVEVLLKTHKLINVFSDRVEGIR